MAATYRDIPNHLTNNNEFKGNSMSARRYASGAFRWNLSGMLDEYEREVLREDAERINYVVFSYSTPIAWATRDGAVHVVDQTFSQTTTRQQNLCRAWLSA